MAYKYWTAHVVFLEDRAVVTRVNGERLLEGRNYRECPTWEDYLIKMGNGGWEWFIAVDAGKRGTHMGFRKPL